MLVLFPKDMKYCMFSHFSYTTTCKNDSVHSVMKDQLHFCYSYK